MTDLSTIEAPVLPAGYTVRPTTMDDAEAVAALATQISQALGVPATHEAQSIRVDWEEPDFNLAESSIVIENDAGDLVANASFWDTSNPPIQIWLGWHLRPDLYGSGLAEYILGWFDTLAPRVIDRCPPAARIKLSTPSYNQHPERIAVLKDAGFEHKRNFHRMLIEMDSAPPVPQLPEGIRIRSFRYPEEIPAMAQLVEDAFRDHWGFYETPLDENIKLWTHHLANDDKFDPAVYFLAEEITTGKLVGMSLCRVEQHGRPENAYVEELGVLREFRRRGLALALLHHTFSAFWQRGTRSVALHVDADSLTGATRLYEKAGMHADETWMNWQKILRDGEDLTTTTVED